MKSNLVSRQLRLEWLFITVAATALAACGGSDDPVPPPPPPAPAAAPTIAIAGETREELVVTKSADDGTQGTLRWAIQTSNGTPGRYRISLINTGGVQLVIKPTTQLPAIAGPARITGTWQGTGEPAVAVDGSAWLDTTVLNAQGNPTACPGQAANQFGANVRSLLNAGLQVVDSANVEIHGFEVRNMCTGIMLWRSKDNNVHHMRLVNNRGASGVLVTGDAGDAGGTPTSGLAVNNRVENNHFLNNGDAMDVARGANLTVIKNNSFVMDAQGIVPSQGIEILSSDSSTIENNTFSGFAEALQINGNSHVITGNTVRNGSIAATLRGTNVKFTANTLTDNRMGVRTATAVTTGGVTTGNTLSQNLIYDNSKDISLCNAGGICVSDVNWNNAKVSIAYANTGPLANDGAGACADGFPDCDGRQNYPVLTPSAVTNASFVVGGTLTSRPAEVFVIELFASHSAGNLNGDAERYLTSLEVTTNASGAATFSIPTANLNPLGDNTKMVYFTATATRKVTGQTSETTQPVLVTAP